MFQAECRMSIQLIRRNDFGARSPSPPDFRRLRARPYGCRKIDAIGFIAMARERGRGSVELDSRLVVNRSETRCPRYARFFPMLQKDFCNRICQNRNHAVQQTAS
jgi:hypothetical protein